MNSDRLRRGLVFVGGAVVVAGAALTWKSARRPGPGSVEANAMPAQRSFTPVNDPQPLPEFTLDSPAGPVTRSSLVGGWSFIFFGYTQCPDVCPSALSLMADLHERLAPKDRPGVLFISVDPQRDTGELLAAYVPAFNPAFRGASGSDAALSALVGHLGVVYLRHPPSRPEHPAIYTVDHTAAMFLIDPQARLRAVFSPPHDAAAMLADYQRLTRA
jgi:protein SCO1/2